MEYWDIYDADKKVTGRTMKKNDWILQDGEYHLTVLGVVQDMQGRYLITVLPVICVLCGVGMDEFSKAVTEKFEGKKPALAKFGKLVPAIAATGLFLMFIVIFYTVILPTLTFIYLPGADKVMFYYVR